MSETQILETENKDSDIAFGKTFLSLRSTEAEIQQVLKSRNIFMAPEQAKRFAHVFKKAATHLLEKREIQEISPAMAVQWARNMLNQKRQIRENPFRPNAVKSQREENRDYWHARLKERQMRHEP